MVSDECERQTRPLLLTGGAIALLSALVYVNALRNPFVYDDHRVILENPSLKNLQDWHSILFYNPTRPLVNASYALDYSIWNGPNAFGFHLTNLAIHVVNTLLLFVLGTALADDETDARRRSGRGRAAATAAALLFAVHPVLTPSVGYVSGRPEMLCLMFLMTAFLAARRAMRCGPAWLWVPALGCWMLAVACKEIAVMFPFALLAYDYLSAPTDPDARRRRVWRLHVPLIGATILLGSIRVAVLLTIEHSNPTVFWRFGLVELDVFRRYVQLLLVPTGQTIFHAIEPIRSILEARALLGIATVLLFAFSIWKLRRQNVVSFGFIWFALLLIPSAVLVVVDRGEPMAEGRLYAASAGFFLSAGAIAATILERAGQISPVARRRTRDIGFAIVAVLALRTMTRNIEWQSPVSLWLEATEYAPRHWLPRLALGEALHDAGRHQEAIVMFRESLVLRPSEPLTYAKLGQCELETGQIKAADATFESLRALDPGSTAASTGLGLIALRARDSKVARAYFLETLTKEPNSVPTRQVLASIAEEADPAEALRLCEEISHLAPETPGNDECIRRNRERIDAASTNRGPR